MYFIYGVRILNIYYLKLIDKFENTTGRKLHYLKKDFNNLIF